MTTHEIPYNSLTPSRPARRRRTPPLALLLRDKRWHSLPELHCLRALREQAAWGLGRQDAAACQLLRCLHRHRLGARQGLLARQAESSCAGPRGCAASRRGGWPFRGVRTAELRCGPEDLAGVSFECAGGYGACFQLERSSSRRLGDLIWCLTPTFSLEVGRRKLEQYNGAEGTKPPLWNAWSHGA